MTLAPFVTELFNRSLLTGTVPQAFKAAFITPIITKEGLDAADVKSYRPISNLTVLSKLLERLVAGQMKDYIDKYHLLPDFQSAYRIHHSTETAVLKVSSDILQAVDEGDIGVLVLLDLSAAFDTVDHQILLQRLSVSCGFGGMVRDWFDSYLEGRTQHVEYLGSKSTDTVVTCGVPQGSVLGPFCSSYTLRTSVN